MKMMRMLGIALAVLLALPLVGQAQTWTALNHQPTFGVGTILLLKDGRILAENMGNGSGSSNWDIFTPDSTGSYVNGTWSTTGSLPSGYAPLYFASEVLPNGFVLINGGEYNNGSGVWTTLGAYWNNKTGAWTAVTPPSGWSTIGDAQSVILNTGQYMLANCCTTQEAIVNYQSKAWASTGTGKADINDEEGWTLLPGGTLLTVDANDDNTNSELYNPNTGSWSTAGSTINKLEDPSSHELGPAILRPEGTVFYTGATGFNSIYTPNSNPLMAGTWAAGPKFPTGTGGQLDIADGPAALLPDGNVLCFTSPGVYNTGGVFFEFNGTTLTQEPGTPLSSGDSSYYGHMLVLPTGQIWFSDFSSSVYLYTPTGTYQSSWQPTITSVPTTLTSPHTGYVLKGTQLNGFGGGAAYGDDSQMNTNYPLIELSGGGNVIFLPTHTENTYGLGTGSATVGTEFDVPSGITSGSYTLTVVTNGIPSAGVAVTVN